jgi:hypothetical protein
MITWEKPARLEEFLIPNEINWSIPDWMAGRIPSQSLRNGKELLKNFAVATKPFLTGKVQEYWGGAENYYQVLNGDNCTDNFNSVEKDRASGIAEYEKIYHDLFRALFKPSEPIAHLIDKKLQSRHLSPGEFVGAHYRAFYKTKDRKKSVSLRAIKAEVANAINCASVLYPGAPIYFSSESQVAIEEVKTYAKKLNHQIVTFPHEDDPLHLDKTMDWMSRNASDFYSVFVDMLVLGDSRCITFNEGGYGRFASL